MLAIDGISVSHRSVNLHMLTMQDTPERRTSPLGLRLLPSVKAALDKAAKDERRPVASYVEIVLMDHLRAKGYLPAEPHGTKT